MPSHLSSHASIGSSTMRDRHVDTTTSSFGGPEDFTADIMQHLQGDKKAKSLIHSNNRLDLTQLSESSVGGPEDFTADIIRHLQIEQIAESPAQSSKKMKSPARSRQPTVSDAEEDTRPISISLLVDADLTTPLAESTKLEGGPPAPSKQEDEMKSLHQQLEQLKVTLAQKDETLRDLQATLAQKDQKISGLETALTQQDEKLARKIEMLAQKDEMLAQQDEIMAQQDEMIVQRDEMLGQKDEMLAEADETVGILQARLSTKTTETRNTNETLETKIKHLKASTSIAQAEATRARREQEEREKLWIQRSEVLLAEIDRRGQAVMWAIGEKECPGMVDEKGRQAYRYQIGKDYRRVSKTKAKPSIRYGDSMI